MSQIGVYVSPKPFNREKYEGTVKQLEAAGAGSPKGRLYHFCFGEGDELMVFDVWESQEAFDAFGQSLIPIMSKLGIDIGEPAIMPMVNTIIGK